MFPFFIKKNRLGLVLGGGGARGFFHMGVIKALQELDIPISEISGTSIGALIGAIYAANPKVDFDKIAQELNFLKITQLIASHLDKSSVSKLENEIKKYIAADYFSQLKIPFTCNAVDVNNSQEIIFNHGSVLPAVVSSLSIPGVLPPIEYQNRLLVDGGVLNNIPISHLKMSNKIIVSDISGPIKTIDKKTKSLDIFYSSIAIMQKHNSLNDPQTQKIIHKTKPIFLTLTDNQIFILDFRKKNFIPLIQAGYTAAMQQKDQLLSLTK